jgi:hypothetical protein
MEREPTPGRHNPILLGLIGLALMLAGWKASTYVPATARDAEQEKMLAELRALAARSADTGQGRLAEVLPRYAPRPWRSPPYQVPGRIAFVAGLLLFVAAGVLMYRQPPPPDPGTEAIVEGTPAAGGTSPRIRA